MLLEQPCVPLARSGARETETRTGLFLLCEVQGGLSWGQKLSKERMLLALAQVTGVQFTQRGVSKDTRGSRTTSRKVSGRLSIAAEVVPDWRTGEVVISVCFRSK